MQEWEALQGRLPVSPLGLSLSCSVSLVRLSSRAPGWGWAPPRTIRGAHPDSVTLRPSHDLLRLAGQRTRAGPAMK